MGGWPSTGPTARALAAADDETLARIREATASALAPWQGPQGITLPGSAWVVSAAAPAAPR